MLCLVIYHCFINAISDIRDHTPKCLSGVSLFWIRWVICLLLKWMMIWYELSRNEKVEQYQRSGGAEMLRDAVNVFWSIYKMMEYISEFRRPGTFLWIIHWLIDTPTELWKCLTFQSLNWRNLFAHFLCKQLISFSLKILISELIRDQLARFYQIISPVWKV